MYAILDLLGLCIILSMVIAFFLAIIFPVEKNKTMTIKEPELNKKYKIKPKWKNSKYDGDYGQYK
jgi:hypothetical protein|tara:strand:- start:596 stop:790 length:195 start_codon:yes stop_codon:yes gene_type:complete